MKSKHYQFLQILDYYFLIAVLIIVTYLFLTNFYTYWDALAYHLPFAARIAHIFPKDSLTLSPLLERRYDGFPLLGEAIEGGFWKLFNTIGATSLINLLAYLIFVLYIKIRNNIPIITSTLFLFSIPLLSWGFFSGYLDFFVSLILASAFISLYNVYREHKLVDIFLTLSFLSIVANTKFTVIVFVLIAFFLLLYLVWNRHKKLALVCLVFLPVILASNIKNEVKFGNPFYPLKMPILSSKFPNYTESSSDTPGPLYLKNYPTPIKYLISVSEINTYDPARPTLWTIDQGDVSPNSKGFRMGGYFVLNILLWISAAVLIFRKSLEQKEVRYALFAIAGLTLLTSVMPQAYELRYWAFGPLLLFVFILCNLQMLPRPAKFGLFTLQVLILLFVTYRTRTFVGSALPPFSKFNLSSLTTKTTACLYATQDPNLILYRMSTPASIKIEIAENKNACIYSPLQTKF